MSARPPKTFEKTFPNRLADLGRVTEEAIRFLQESAIADKAVNAANLAIEEMTTNILKYGYDDAAVHEILLCVENLRRASRRGS